MISHDEVRERADSRERKEVREYTDSNESLHRIDILEESLKRDTSVINTKLDRILSQLEAQQPTHDRLDRHITFIESVYSRLRGTIDALSSIGSFGSLWWSSKKEPLSIV